MNDDRTAHAPGLPTAPLPTLDGSSLLRDQQTGEIFSLDDWVSHRRETSGRPEDVCREELMNLVARGDVVAVKRGESTP